MSQALVQQARAALQADPTRGEAWIAYIETLIDDGQADEARKTITLGGKKGLPDHILSSLLHRLDLPKAPSTADTGTPDEPGEAEVQNLTTLLATRDHAQLLPLATAMTSRFPGFAFGWSVLGASLSAQGRHADALYPAQMAAMLSPEGAGEHYNLGRTLAALKRNAEATQSFRHAILLNPKFVEAHHQLAIGLHMQGRIEEALTSYRALLDIKPDIADVYYNLGLIFHGQGRLHAALASFRRALRLNPDMSAARQNVDALASQMPASLVGVERSNGHPPGARASAVEPTKEYLASGLYEEAEQAAFALTRAAPDIPEAWRLLALSLLAQKRFNDALDPATQTTRLGSRDADAHFALAQVLAGLGRHGGQVESLQTVLKLRPDHAPARLALGGALHGAGRIVDAEAAYREVLKADPTHATSLKGLGSIHRARGELPQAMALLQLAAQADPTNASVHLELASAAHALGHNTVAEAGFKRSLQLEPANYSALANLAVVLSESNRFEEAEVVCRKALELRPHSIECLNNLSNILGGLEQHAASLEVCRHLLTLAPLYGQAHHTEGFALQTLGQLDQAESSYRRAIELRPGFNDSHANLLFLLNYHPDKRAEEIYLAYAAFEQQFGAALRSNWATHANVSRNGRRLRIGYVSPDLRRHAVGHFLEPLLANHDRSRLEVFAYAEIAAEDAVTARYRGYCDHFILTRGMSDEALADRIRADGIDVLVDVAGHTTGNRLMVFARKPASVSLSWMGYGYTTGLKAIDYFLIDEASAPVGSEHLFAETPWRLPCAYAYRPGEGMGEVSALPAMSSGRVTFGSLTRSIRINHRTIRVWSQILKRVPNSVLVIDSRNFQHVSMQEALAARFAEHGIRPEQLRIGCHSPPWDTLRAMDIALDCFPHNSGTTLFESLYMGVPFITLAGRPSVGRLGRTVLRGLGKQEWLNAWCVDSEEDYIDKAVALASDLQALQQIRSELRPQMQRSALMDEVGFARNVEQAYEEMLTRRQNTQTQEADQ